MTSRHIAPTRLNWIEEPFHDSFGIPRKYHSITIVLGVLARFVFVVVLVVAWYLYAVQEIKEQIVVAQPQDGFACQAIGSLSLERLFNLSTSTLISMQFVGHIGAGFGSHETVCSEWMNLTLSSRINTASSASPSDYYTDLVFTTTADQCVFPSGFNLTRAQQMLISGNFDISEPHPCVLLSCVGVGRGLSSVTNLDGSIVGARKIMIDSCQEMFPNDTSIDASSIQNPSLYAVPGDDEGLYSLNFLCNGMPAYQLIQYGGPCRPSQLRKDFQVQFRSFCKTFPAANGPYLCSRTSHRAPFDIVNLAFAAGTTSFTASLYILRPVHRFINKIADPLKVPSGRARADTYDL